MKSIIRPAAVLFLICLVTGVSLAFTYEATKDRIAANSGGEAGAARAAVMPGAALERVFALTDAEISRLAEFPAVVELYRATQPGEVQTAGAGETQAARAAEAQTAGAGDGRGDPAGYVATVAAKGYGGELYVVVGLRADGKITGVRVTRHQETPGLGAKAAKPEYYEQYAGKNALAGLITVKGALKASGGETADNEITGGDDNNNVVVAISGATATSEAVTDAVNAAAKFIAEYDDDRG